VAELQGYFLAHKDLPKDAVDAATVAAALVVPAKAEAVRVAALRRREQEIETRADVIKRVASNESTAL
jgi:hypothetical protein